MLRCSIRELQAELVGQLSTIKGTVTRTSIVRPELLYGTFQCNDCKEMYPDVQQQFAFTTVSAGNDQISISLFKATKMFESAVQ